MKRQRALIVKINVEDMVDLGVIAEDIKDALEQDGYEVIGVDPWKTQEEIQTLAGSLLSPPPTGGLTVEPPEDTLL